MNEKSKIKRPFNFSKPIDIKKLHEILDSPIECSETRERFDLVCNSVLTAGAAPMTVRKPKVNIFGNETNEYEKIETSGGLAPGVLDAFKQYKAKRSYQHVFLPIFSHLQQVRDLSDLVLDYFDDNPNPVTQIKQLLNEPEKEKPKEGFFSRLFKK